MIERSQVPVVKEEMDRKTVPELVNSLKSAFQKAYFSEVEEALIYREEKLKREIENKNEEKKLLLEKFHMEELEKLKFQNECLKLQKECGELKELASGLRKERDGLLKKFEEFGDAKKEIIELKKKKCALECAKLNAETELEVTQERFKIIEEKVLNLEKDSEMLSKWDKSHGPVNVELMEIEKGAFVNATSDTNSGKRKASEQDKIENRVNVEEETGKFDADVKVLSEANPSCSSSHQKRRDNWRPLSQEIVEIIDSDDESASRESARGVVTEHQDKPHSVQNVGENEPPVHSERTLASFLDVDDICPTAIGKRVNVQEHGPFGSPVEHHSPAILNSETPDSDQTHSVNNAAENESAVHKRTLASSVDVGDSFSSAISKRLKIQEHGPFASPVEHRSPALLNSETPYSGTSDASLRLSKLLSELGDDSSSSSSSDSDDDELDLSLDYSAIYRTAD